IPCYDVVRQGDLVRVGQKLAVPRRTSPATAPASVVVIGAGAAGAAAVEMLRREGFAGSITLIGAEETVPVDPPNLSKDYLAGTAPEEWMPLRSREFSAELGVELLLGTLVASVDTAQRKVLLADGKALPYGALLLATGAEPIRVPVPGADLP